MPLKTHPPMEDREIDPDDNPAACKFCLRPTGGLILIPDSDSDPKGRPWQVCWSCLDVIRTTGRLPCRT